MNAADLILLVARLWMATVMLRHGINHGKNLESTAAWFAQKGFKQARMQAAASAAGEVAIAAGLAVGLLTPFAAAGLVATMLVAFWSIHRFAGFFVFHRPDEGYEYVATLSMLALVVAALGPGRYSLDQAFGIVVNGWTGLAVGLAGLVAGGIQLAVFWRRPKEEE